MNNKYLAQDFGSSYDKNNWRDGLAWKKLLALPLGGKTIEKLQMNAKFIGSHIFKIIAYLNYVTIFVKLSSVGQLYQLQKLFC
jgi:hypothetical protein